MNQDLLVTMLAAAMIVAGAAPAVAQQQETRHLDADGDGTAQEAGTTNTFDAEVNVTGDVIVQESEEGQDETAYTQGPNVTANVTIGETTYEIPVGVNGEGTSFEQMGVTADGWRLHVQGTQLPSGQDDASTIASFSGNLTLTGGQDGEYVLQGDGTLTVVDGDETTNYHLNYTGEATFE